MMKEEEEEEEEEEEDECIRELEWSGNCTITASQTNQSPTQPESTHLVRVFKEGDDEIAFVAGEFPFGGGRSV